jgi:hypothetical protein
VSAGDPARDEVAAAALDDGGDDGDRLHYRSPVMK